MQEALGKNHFDLSQTTDFRSFVPTRICESYPPQTRKPTSFPNTQPTAKPFAIQTFLAIDAASSDGNFFRRIQRRIQGKSHMWGDEQDDDILLGTPAYLMGTLCG